MTATEGRISAALSTQESLHTRFFADAFRMTRELLLDMQRRSLVGPGFYGESLLRTGSPDAKEKVSYVKDELEEKLVQILTRKGVSDSDREYVSRAVSEAISLVVETTLYECATPAEKALTSVASVLDTLHEQGRTKTRDEDVFSLSIRHKDVTPYLVWRALFALEAADIIAVTAEPSGRWEVRVLNAEMLAKLAQMPDFH